MIKPLTIKHIVKKEAQGTYYTLGFSVPENVIKVTVTYEYTRRAAKPSKKNGFVNIIDIGLIDGQGRFLGWSGSNHKTIFVGEFGSSNGYLSQPIMPGNWGIIIGAYHVAADGVEVTYTVEFEERGTRLLFGDLHVHSDASDGEFDIPELAKRARKIGLDFLGAANHNNFAENFNLPHVNGLTFIPVVEWTHYKGHMNFFGVAAPFENSFIANSEEEMKALIDHAKSLGALISINHPKCGLCPYLWDDNESFDMVEVWNGPMRPANMRAITWWTEFLRQGRHLPIVGGSDFHKRYQPVFLGHPVTAVYTASPGAEDIVKAIAAGHAFVTGSVGGARLSLKYGEAIMGDTVKAEKGVPLEIKAENLRGAKLILVTADGEKRLKTKGGEAFLKEPPPLGFAYLKAVKKIGGMELAAAISNPIYFQ